MTSLAELHDRARERLAPERYDFFAGGASDEVALAENERAFRRLALLPRVLRGNAHRPMAVELPGKVRAAMPIFASPTAFHRLAHPEGELATARATAAAGTVLIASMAATARTDDIVAAARSVRSDAAVWQQLYLQSDAAVTECLVHRAEDGGCSALVVTVDSPVFGRRERDRRTGFTDLPPGFAAENMRDLPGEPPGSVRDIEMSPMLSWSDLDLLRAMTTLPVLIKGVLHPQDARLAVEHGIDGILVSNHGGRQLDAAPAAIDVLPAIAEVVGGQVPLLLDGGVRRGSDVALALALGATAVGVGRPVVWGLAADGERGVRDVLELLREEFDHTLALCGVRGLAELTRDLVTVRGPEVGKR